MIDRKTYYSIDVAKFAAACLVLILHTSPFASYSSVLNLLTRNFITPIAVPLFFCMSGFLFYDKMIALKTKEKKKYLVSYEKRLIYIYVIWSIIYFPFVLYNWLKDGEISFYEVFLYIKEFFFVGSYSTIWFLLALAVAIFLAWWLARKIGIKMTVIFGVILYSFACIASEIYGAVLSVPLIGTCLQGYLSFFEGFKNGFFFGFPFVALGMLISEKRSCDSFCTTSRKKSLFLFLLFFLLTFVETSASLVLQRLFHMETNGCDFKIFMLPTIYFAVLFILESRINIEDKYSRWLRKMSMLMFLTQRIFITITDEFLDGIIILSNSLVYFVWITATTVLFSMLIMALSNRFTFLKKIY